MKKYFPVLLSKEGELGALQRLDQKVKEGVCPIMEVLDQNIIKRTKDGLIYNDKVEKKLKTHWAFENNELILDFSLFDNWRINKKYVMKFLRTVITGGVNITLAVQKNSNPIYIEIVKEIIKTFKTNICIRVSNNSGGFLNINEDINDMCSIYEASSSNTSILLDLGKVLASNFNLISSTAVLTINSLEIPVENWNHVIVCSGSFPENLSDFLVQDEAHLITRYEWNVWREIKNSKKLKHVKYGDYGTKSPIYTDVSFAGSVSLKYTSEKYFLIFRGEKTDRHRDGHGQFITHCNHLINSTKYSGNDFSWGDINYYEIGNQDIGGRTGNTSNWVQYSQNHHITLMYSIL